MSGGLDRMLTELHEALGGMLDVESGLHDARHADVRTDVDTALGKKLDVGSGLAAIVSGPAARRRQGLHDFAETLATQPPHVRLTVRRAGWPDAVRDTRRTARLLLTAIDVNQDIHEAFRVNAARPRARDFDRAIRRLLALSRAMDDPASAHFPDLARQVNHLYLVLKQDLSHQWRPNDPPMASVLDDARSLVHTLLRELTADFAHLRPRTFRNAVLHDIREIKRLFSAQSVGAAREHVHEAVRAVERIDALVSDFPGADLTRASLAEVPLNGIRWSDTTKWPTGWAGLIQLRSVEVAPGLFVIGRRGRGRRVRVDQVP